MYSSVIGEIKHLFQPAIKRISRPVGVTPGRGPHISSFAAQGSPSALSRADDGVKQSQRVHKTVIAPHSFQLAVPSNVERNGLTVAIPVEYADDDRFWTVVERG